MHYIQVIQSENVATLHFEVKAISVQMFPIKIWNVEFWIQFRKIYYQNTLKRPNKPIVFKGVNQGLRYI